MDTLVISKKANFKRHPSKSKTTIQWFIDHGLNYESGRYHNMVLLGTDAEGKSDIFELCRGFMKELWLFVNLDCKIRTIVLY